MVSAILKALLNQQASTLDLVIPPCTPSPPWLMFYRAGSCSIGQRGWARIANGSCWPACSRR